MLLDTGSIRALFARHNCPRLRSVIVTSVTPLSQVRAAHPHAAGTCVSCLMPPSLEGQNCNEDQNCNDGTEETIREGN
jgi:hypothetical protein